MCTSCDCTVGACKNPPCRFNFPPKTKSSLGDTPNLECTSELMILCASGWNVNFPRVALIDFEDHRIDVSHSLLVASFYYDGIAFSSLECGARIATCEVPRSLITSEIVSLLINSVPLPI